MSTRVATLSIFIDADIGGAERGIRSALSLFGQARASAEQSTASLSIFNRSLANDTTAAADRARGSLFSMGQAAAYAVGGLMVSAIQTGISWLTSMAGSMTQAYMDNESLTKSLNQLTATEYKHLGFQGTIKEAIAATSEKAKELKSWVVQLAVFSPFGQKGVAEAFRMALAFGFNTTEAKRLTQSLVDFAAATGRGEDVIQRISYALGQMRATGRVLGGDLMQLSNAGVNAREAMIRYGASIGLTEKNYDEWMRKGLIPVDFAIQSVVRSLEEDFGGAAKDQSNTIQGLMNSFMDLKEVLGREFIGPSLEAIRPYLISLVDFLGSDSTHQAVTRLGEKLGNGVAVGMRLVGDAASYVKLGWQALVPTLTAVGEELSKIPIYAQVIGEMFGPTIQAVFTDLGNLGNAVLAPVQNAWNTIADVFTSKYQEARGWGYGIIGAVVEGVMSAFSLVANALQQIGSIFTFWLLPHSPPRAVPKLDEYGRQAGEIYADAIASADTSKGISVFGAKINQQLQGLSQGWSAQSARLFGNILQSASAAIQGASGSGTKGKAAAIGAEFNIQAPLAAAINELSQYGQVSQATFSGIVTAAGTAGPAVGQIVTSYVDLERATRDVAAAQQELNDIQQRYDELTAPLNAELAGIQAQKQRIQDMKTEAQLRKTMSDKNASSSDRSLAALEMQELGVNRQIRALQSQRQTEEQAARKKLDAAKAAQDAAQKQLDAMQAMQRLYQQNNQLLEQQTHTMKQLAGSIDDAGKGSKGFGLGMVTLADYAKKANTAVTDAMGKINTAADLVKEKYNQAKLAVQGFNGEAKRIASTPIVQSIIGMGKAIGDFIGTHWKTFMGALAGARIVMMGNTLVGVFGRIGMALRLLGIGAGVLLSPLNILIAIGALLGAAWASNFANIQRLTPIFGELGDTVGKLFVSIGRGDAKAIGQLGGKLLESVGKLLVTFGKWLIEAGAKIYEYLKPWGIAFGKWVWNVALPWLGEALAGLWSWLMGWIKENGPGVLAQLQVWGHMFGEWVLTTALPWLGKKLSALGAWLLQWIQDNGPGILAQLAVWGQMFGNWVWTVALPWLGQQLGALGAWLLQWIQGNGPGILAQLQTWGQMFGDWVWNTALPWLGQQLQGLWAWLLQWIQTNGPEILAQLAVWGQMFGNWVTTTALPWLGQKLGELWNWLINWIVANGPGIYQKLLGWADMFGDWVVQKALPWLGEKVVGLGEWLLTWISEQGPGILSTLGDWAVKFAEWVPIGIGLLIIALGDLLGRFLGWLIENGPSIGTTLEKWSEQFGNWVGRVITWLVEEGLPKFGAWIRDDLGPALITGLVEMFGLVGQRISELWSAAWAPDSLGGQMVANIKQGITDHWNELRNWVSQKAQALMSAFDPRTWFSGGQQPTGTTSDGKSGGGATASTGTVPGFATGVKNFIGGLAIVGENGPELLRLPRGSDVVPMRDGSSLPTLPSGMPQPTSGQVAAATRSSQPFHVELHINNPQVDSDARLQQLIEKVREILHGDLASLFDQMVAGGV